MSTLPEIRLPRYKLKLLTSDKEIWVRPFTVKEEKILLMAAEGSHTDMAIAILQIIENCILDKEIIVENLPFFEDIYIFLYLKKISSGEDLTITIKESEKNEKGIIQEKKYTAKCNLENDVIVDNIDFLKNNDKNIIKIEGNDIYIRIKPILYKDYIKLTKMSDNITKNNDKKNNKTDELKLLYNTILMTIKEIFDKENTYNPDDFSLEELTRFYDSIPYGDKEKIKQLYNELPKIKFKFKYTDEKGFEKEKIIENINSDFLA